MLPWDTTQQTQQIPVPRHDNLTAVCTVNTLWASNLLLNWPQLRKNLFWSWRKPNGCPSSDISQLGGCLGLLMQVLGNNMLPGWFMPFVFFIWSSCAGFLFFSFKDTWGLNWPILAADVLGHRVESVVPFPRPRCGEQSMAVTRGVTPLMPQGNLNRWNVLST